VLSYVIKVCGDQRIVPCSRLPVPVLVFCMVHVNFPVKNLRHSHYTVAIRLLTTKTLLFLVIKYTGTDKILQNIKA